MRHEIERTDRQSAISEAAPIGTAYGRRNRRRLKRVEDRNDTWNVYSLLMCLIGPQRVMIGLGHFDAVECIIVQIILHVGFDQRSCATSDPVSTRMGDRLWTGKPSRYVTSQLGRLSLLYPPWDGKMSISFRAE